jgi:hypothetical protein
LEEGQEASFLFPTLLYGWEKEESSILEQGQERDRKAEDKLERKEGFGWNRRDYSIIKLFLINYLIFLCKKLHMQIKQIFRKKKIEK